MTNKIRSLEKELEEVKGTVKNTANNIEDLSSTKKKEFK